MPNGVLWSKLISDGKKLLLFFRPFPISDTSGCCTVQTLRRVSYGKGVRGYEKWIDVCLQNSDEAHCRDLATEESRRTQISKNLGTTSHTSRRQKGGMQQVPKWGPTIIMHLLWKGRWYENTTERNWVWRRIELLWLWAGTRSWWL